jgi:hypothetical protein
MVRGQIPRRKEVSDLNPSSCSELSLQGTYKNSYSLFSIKVSSDPQSFRRLSPVSPANLPDADRCAIVGAECEAGRERDGCGRIAAQ